MAAQGAVRKSIRLTSTVCPSQSNGLSIRSRSLIRRRSTVRARSGWRWLSVLVPSEPLEELDGECRPSGDIGCQLLQRRKPTLVSSVPNRVGDFAARDQEPVQRPAFRCRVVGRRSGVLHRKIADEIAQVRHGPFVSCLDEPVEIKLLDVVLDDVHLFGDDPQQCPRTYSAARRRASGRWPGADHRDGRCENRCCLS